MVIARHDICNGLLKSTSCKCASSEEVCGFFEEIGLYMKREVFDLYLVWEIYGDYVLNYWLICKPAILELRKTHRTAYASFENLYDQCVAHSARTEPEAIKVAMEDLKMFAEAEVQDKSEAVLNVAR